jgi:D-alanyl-D-alanine carboxypeptidase
MRRPPPLRALPIAAILGLGLLGAPASVPAPVAGVGPLPECRLDDIFAEPRDLEEWAITQVDWILTLGPDYRPNDLVSVREGGVAGGGMIRAIVIDDLRAMALAAEENGTPLVSWSPYRGYNQQVRLFNGYAGWNGTRYTNFQNAITFSARPGHSEHQLGTTIDFVAVGDDGLTSNWEVTRTGGWMARNAWKYGWLMTYPEGKQAVTCYRYEPWHYRYVGRDLAAKVHESGLTLREYLWEHHTEVDPACVALPPPELVTPGVPRSCAFAEPSPSPVATAPRASAPGTLPPATPSPGPTAAGSTPVPTAPPASPTGSIFGLEPALALTLLAIALGAGGLLLARGALGARRR